LLHAIVTRGELKALSAYPPGCVEEVFYEVELPIYGVLGSSAKVGSQKPMLVAPKSSPRGYPG
jgi:hypothetical protein